MKDSIILLTGADHGIGLAMTESLLALGHKVAAIDISCENLAALEKKSPGFCRYIHCDVTDLDSINKTVQSVVDDWGRIDILVNNACLAIFAKFEDKAAEETRREFEVNFFGYLNMIRAVQPIMKSLGNGVIHNVSSGVGLTGFPGLCGYTSTKGAIEALTRTLAIEFQPYGIIVNTIHPPLTRTKSASPLGIPEQMMADPKLVGERLARKIGRNKPSLTPDFSTALGLFANQHFPNIMGNLLAKMTAHTHQTNNLPT